MKWLALDVGSKRIGVAVADALGITVSPRPLIQAGPQAIAQVCRLIEDENPGGLVVGMPYQNDGTATGEACELVAAFVAQLRPHLTIPLEFHDESYSSQKADEQLRASKVKRGQRRDRQDSVAATIILREFLDARARAAAPVRPQAPPSGGTDIPTP